MDYPIWNPSMGGGVLIGIVAIAHVVVSHFAIGAGLVLAITETIAVRRGDAILRQFLRRGSTLLILLSTVFGAISGVAIWFTIGLISPAATSALIRNYVWGWAIEWTFFLAEVATALAWALSWDRVRPRTHVAVIWIYLVAAFLSLVIIQGILSFMLTPGEWIRTGGFWDGFFNPTYFPGLVFRTGLCLILASAYLMLAAQREKDPAARGRIVRWLAVYPLVGAPLAWAGFAWWQSVLPESVRVLYAGSSALLVSLGATVRWVPIGLLLVFVLSLFAWLLPRGHRWPTAVIALLAGFLALGAYERLREGLRKPFVIRDYMFSNGIRVDQIGSLNESGVLAASGWAAREAGGAAGRPAHGGGATDDEHLAGRAVFRVQCSSCHTLDGYLSIRGILAGADPDRVNGVIGLMRADGDAWLAAREEGRVAPGVDELTYAFMPPFVGTEEEAATLGVYLLQEVGVRLANGAQGDRLRDGELARAGPLLHDARRARSGEAAARVVPSMAVVSSVEGEQP